MTAKDKETVTLSSSHLAGRLDELLCFCSAGDICLLHFEKQRSYWGEEQRRPLLKVKGHSHQKGYTWPNEHYMLQDKRSM